MEKGFSKQGDLLSNASYGAVISNPMTQLSTEDPWAIVDLVDDSKKWKDMTTKEKIFRVFGNGLKILSAVSLLYFFICSLDLLASAFRLISGKTAGTIFRQNKLMQNPVVGLMIGILGTVLVQSSSTSTSIVVSMVGTNVLTVGMAIPIIMGSNIGTSVTNTIVSFAQIGNKNEFRRAFAGAIVHDIFNWLTVFVLFTVELICQPIFGVGYLEWLSGIAVGKINSSASTDGEINILKEITDPVVGLVIQIDQNVIKGWANDDPNYENASLIRQCGGNITDPIPCEGIFLFENTTIKDWSIGLILLAISLFVLCGSMICLVKILNSMMKGHIANVIKHIVNAKIPYLPWLTGYIALLVGAGMTFIVRSSSVFTSALNPLIGIGFISIERVYPLTLGSNVGTTTTALLAAFAASPDALHDTLQIALVHLFFNVTGILLFYPIPFMRLPIPMAKFLGDVTAKYRWFAIVSLVGMFFVLPAAVLGLSVAGTVALQCVGIPFLIIIVATIVINVLQKKSPAFLPPVLRNWMWLPEFCRSLEPYDRQLSRLSCCNRFSQDGKEKTVNVVTEISSKPLSGESVP
ncbi:(+)/Pi cotransporter [Daphnia sinensis]|uniref:(+)/Pi cotransporter n=1 Tax=Daphnia sinensis TaxID=1820382 RepID=A0AAD5PV93_9CRUS|nr:(+)/Pi cotransporter [Daphnia sinensis]